MAILKIQNLSSFELLGRTKNKIIERTPITKRIILLLQRHCRTIENVSNLIQNQKGLISNTEGPQITSFCYNTDEML